MSKNSDIKATIKSLIENLQLGNKSGTEVAQSVNVWLKEGGEALKVKIEDEVERSVSKMGFVKRGSGTVLAGTSDFNFALTDAAGNGLLVLSQNRTDTGGCDMIGTTGSC